MARGPEYDAATREGQRAVGRYFIEFSALIWVMRLQLHNAMDWRGGDSHVINIMTADMNPTHLRNVFFAVISHLADPPHNDADKAVAAALRDLVGKAIEDRNDAAHGEWFVGWGGADSDLPTPPMLRRDKANRQRDPIVGSEELTVETLDMRSDDLVTLRRHVHEFATWSVHLPGSLLPAFRVSDVLVSVGTRERPQVVREGPEAQSGGAGTGPVL